MTGGAKFVGDNKRAMMKRLFKNLRFQLSVSECMCLYESGQLHVKLIQKCRKSDEQKLS